MFFLLYFYCVVSALLYCLYLCCCTISANKDSYIYINGYNACRGPVTEYNIFDKLPSTATGMDDLPACFLYIGVPFFYKALAYLFNKWPQTDQCSKSFLPLTVQTSDLFSSHQFFAELWTALLSRSSCTMQSLTHPYHCNLLINKLSVLQGPPRLHLLVY